MSIKELLLTKKILICCGSGGVGKTTLSACLGLSAAKCGLNVLVLTIDPARRLANSLGLDQIDFKEKVIPKSFFQEAKINCPGKMTAMMLDIKSTFDKLIHKHAPNQDVEQNILNNPLYQHLSNMIAGSGEYMAMEKLYELASEKKYDLIILDTPPSRHALDFLDAPKKMSSLLGESVLKVFLKPGLFVGKKGLKFLERGSRKIFKAFDKVMGFEFLQDLSTLFISTSSLFDGFQERALEVSKILESEDSSFFLISSAQEASLEEAQYFIQKLKEYQSQLGAILFNRVYPFIPEQEQKELNQFFASKSLEKVGTSFLDLYSSLSSRDRKNIQTLSNKWPKNTEVLEIPQYQNDVHGIEDLEKISQMLLNQ